jgi:hypothetical protein
VAGVALADQVARIAFILTRMHAGPHGLARSLVNQWEPGPQRTLIAKACGATPEQVEMWLDGRAVPPPTQALALITALYETADPNRHGPVSLNGVRPPRFAESGAER